MPVVSWSAKLVSLLIQPEDIACDGNFLFSAVGQVLFQHNPECNLFKLPAWAIKGFLSLNQAEICIYFSLVFGNEEWKTYSHCTCLMVKPVLKAPR